MWFPQAQGRVELQIREHGDMLQPEGIKSLVTKLYRKKTSIKICDTLSPNPVQEIVHVCS